MQCGLWGAVFLVGVTGIHYRILRGVLKQGCGLTLLRPGGRSADAQAIKFAMELCVNQVATYIERTEVRITSLLSGPALQSPGP